MKSSFSIKLAPLNLFVFTCVWLFLDTNLTLAQNNPAAKKRKQPVPAPERVLLETKDGVELRAQWFGGIDGKETMPIILVHDWDGNRSDLTSLATRLQKDLKAAVIVPDLRGHGESITVKGSSDELDRKRFKKAQILTLAEDIDTCRRFLQEKNDLGELNLDILSIVACGKNCGHAVNWCLNDWRWGPIGGVKQGQNVKALVMVSPRRKFKSVSVTQALKNPLFTSPDGLSVLVIWGDGDVTGAKDGAAIHDNLKKARREPTKFNSSDEQKKNQTVYEMILGSNAVGSDLINENQNKIVNALNLFLELRVLSKREEYAWQSRADK